MFFLHIPFTYSIHNDSLNFCNIKSRKLDMFMHFIYQRHLTVKGTKFLDLLYEDFVWYVPFPFLILPKENLLYDHTWPAVTVCGEGGGDKKNRDPYYSRKNYNVHEWATGGRWG